MDLTDLTGPASVRQPWWELCASVPPSVCAASARIFRGILFYPAYSVPLLLGQGVVRLARHTELKFH